MAPRITHIKDLTHDPENARKHTERNVGMLVDALQEVGAARSIVIDEAGIILAGNATVEAAAEAGLTKVQVVDTDGDTIVAVRRKGLTPEQKTRLALYDNRVAELAQWDPAVLERLSDTGGLDGMFSDNELARLLATDQGVPDDVAEAWEGMPECVNEDQRPARTLLVHFRTEEAITAFQKLVHQPFTDNAKFIWYPQEPIGVTKDKRYARVAQDAAE